jgi:gamma-glutamyltranspeptidase/glutathione hydrolase
VEVPLPTLLSRGYARERLKAIDPGRAFPGMPAPGDVGRPAPRPARRAGAARREARDTTYLCVIDRAGDGFSATPSDGYSTGPVIPGLGFTVSTRGDQSWLEEGHASAVAPWKRPRLTPNPALVLRRGELHMVLGTPGGDVQCQAMLQVLLNHVVFGMGPQAAIEAPRFATYSFPNSFYPHESQPGLLRIEAPLAAHAEELARRGHRIQVWRERNWRAGGVCAIVREPRTGYRVAGADPRRECYALAW